MSKDEERYAMLKMLGGYSLEENGCDKPEDVDAFLDGAIDAYKGLPKCIPGFSHYGDGHDLGNCIIK